MFCAWKVFSCETKKFIFMQRFRMFFDKIIIEKQSSEVVIDLFTSEPKMK